MSWLLTKWENPIIPPMSQVDQPPPPLNCRLPGDVINTANEDRVRLQNLHLLTAHQFWDERLRLSRPPLKFYSESLEDSIQCEPGDYVLIARESHTDSEVVKYHHIPPALFQDSMFPGIKDPRRHSTGVSVDQSVAPTPNSKYHRVRSNIYPWNNDRL